MTGERILVACIGNIFRGDDAFGVEVARRLSARALPAGVLVKDFGIRGFDLTYALMDPRELTLLVDACPRGDQPGAIYVIEPDPPETEPVEDSQAPLETHGMNPMNVLRVVNAMGGAPSRILVVGCEPFDLGSEDEGKLGLSEIVEAAVGEAAELIETLVSRVLAGESVDEVLRSEVLQSH